MATPEHLQELRQGVEAWHQEQDQRETQALRDSTSSVRVSSTTPQTPPILYFPQ